MTLQGCLFCEGMGIVAARVLQEREESGLIGVEIPVCDEHQRLVLSVHLADRLSPLKGEDEEKHLAEMWLALFPSAPADLHKALPSLLRQLKNRIRDEKDEQIECLQEQIESYQRLFSDLVENEDEVFQRLERSLDDDVDD